jgi:hypothetical protein
MEDEADRPVLARSLNSSYSERAEPRELANPPITDNTAVPSPSISFPEISVTWNSSPGSRREDRSATTGGEHRRACLPGKVRDRGNRSMTPGTERC